MSMTICLIVEKLPENNDEAWKKIDQLCEAIYEDKRDKAPALVELHSVLTQRYPCLSSYTDNDPGINLCPWADGPMIDNFCHDIGMLALSSHGIKGVIPYIIEQANALGISVVIGQFGKIYRPGHNETIPWK